MRNDSMAFLELPIWLCAPSLFGDRYAVADLLYRLKSDGLKNRYQKQWSFCEELGQIPTVLFVFVLIANTLHTTVVSLFLGEEIY